MSDELMRSIDAHMERGEELMRVNRVAFDRNTEAFERNREAFDRNAEAFDHNGRRSPTTNGRPSGSWTRTVSSCARSRVAASG